jgi:hypothetical protein
VAELKEGGGVDGATSSIYQTVASTLPEGEGSLTYDKIKAQVSLDEGTVVARGRASLTVFHRADLVDEAHLRQVQFDAVPVLVLDTAVHLL